MQTDAISSSFDLGAIDQISFAVADIAQALPHYEAVFGGPFRVRDVTLAADQVTYRGQPAEVTMRLAFGKTAGIEIELVQVLDGDAPAAEHLREHGEGLHHVRFPVRDIEAKLAELGAAGFEEIFGGTTSRGSRFAYVTAPASFGYTLFELIQAPGA